MPADPTATHEVASALNTARRTGEPPRATAYVTEALHDALAACLPDGTLPDGTADRVRRSLAEFTTGYHTDPAKVLAAQFDHEHDQLIVLRRVPFTSLCEHHLLPFAGHATVGYLPANGKVVGLSKLARLVHVYACRLQLQERLTDQVAAALTEYLQPDGVGVVVTATHSCLTHRGVQATGAEMVTSRLTGNLRALPEARAEFLSLHRP